MFIIAFSAALAHRPGVSNARIEPDRLELTFSPVDLATLVYLDPEVQRSRLLIADTLLAQSPLRVNGEACALGESALSAAADTIVLAVPYVCPTGPVVYSADAFLSRLEVGHRHIVESGDGAATVLDAEHPRMTLAAPTSALDLVIRFGGMGMEHIWTGYDHLLFLAALLLAAPTLRAMLLIVTGFTVAHSITLSAAALGVVALPASLVEPAIAASIVWVGLENLVRPPARRRVALTFALGLVHGFGFARMLTDLGLPRRDLVTALVAFNGGVEVGQAAIILALLPALLWLRRFGVWERRAVPGLSVGVAMIGAFWFIQRVVG